MLDKSNMSAPTSLTTTAATIGSGKEQYHNFKGSLGEMSGAGHQARALNKGRLESEMLIEAKFNELAKKILEELKQAQYSKEFFQAIDNIIKEPLAKTLIRPPPQQPTTFSQPKFASQPSQRPAATYQRQQSFGEQQYQEPRSLPMEKQAAPGNQTTRRQQQASSSSKQKSAIPISNGTHTASPRKVATENGPAYPINKSATVDDATLRRHMSVRKSLITTSQDSRKSSSASGTHQPTSQIIKRRFMVNGDDDEEDEDDDDFDDFDDEDDDDDDDDLSGDDYLKRRSSFQCRKQQQQNLNSSKTTQSNPISKSKTLSDATNLQSSDTTTTTTTKSPNSNKQSTFKQAARQSPLYQHQPSTIQQGTGVVGNKSQPKSTTGASHQRFNPITRSNTVTASNGSTRAAASTISQGKYNNQERELYSRQSPSEPKSMILNSKDIRSLYKPHMNYSTSVLGNHRLSDDDEIIIIPTQSPSLVSTSPDGEANQDELTERFSISRTKSFWEKLSKGSSGRRPTGAEINPGESNNGCIIHNGNVKGGRINSNNNTQSYSLSSAAGNKASMNMNGHSHHLDRMDSTGGSNSNYNGSSSGDENGACYSSQQNPTLRELEEMNRQNRLRQTR